MANEKETRHLVEQYRRQANVESGDAKRASANPPNDGSQRPVAPAGSGGSSGANQGGSPPPNKEK